MPAWSVISRLRRAQVRSYELARRPWPAERATNRFAIQFFHLTAELWKPKPTIPPIYTWRRNRIVSQSACNLWKMNLCRRSDSYEEDILTQGFFASRMHTQIFIDTDFGSWDSAEKGRAPRIGFDSKKRFHGLRKRSDRGF